jgi:hypothetical protein
VLGGAFSNFYADITLAGAEKGAINAAFIVAERVRVCMLGAASVISIGTSPGMIADRNAMPAHVDSFR